MNILVTGGAGYIGSIVAEQLVVQGHTIIVVDNFQEGNREAVSPQAKLYPGNIGDPDLLKQVFRENQVDIVMHFAAETTIFTSIKNPKLHFRNNVANGITLLDAMLEHECSDLIFSSTAAIFGNPEYLPIDENHPCLPISAYGESKLMFEQILDSYHNAYGLRFNAFRYFNAAGASGKLGECHQHESHIIPMILQTALGKKEKFRLFGKEYPTRDGTCVRDYIHVLDLTEAHILALQNLTERPARKYNLGNGEGFTNLEVLRMAEKVSDRKVPFTFGPSRPGDPPSLVASSQRAQQELGWIPYYNSLETIVRSAWEWHKANPEGYSLDRKL